ncbi:hypothetical protein GF319_13295 [Candidatus Bathyarchaeota archaeon]|nr:hypothetical protein [Candidatus Bathyarchaeota archaeon]
MGCDHCDLRDNCDIRKMYQRAQSLYEEGNVEEIRKISNQLELHESYIVEMRRDVQSKLVDLIRNKKKEIE